MTMMTMPTMRRDVAVEDEDEEEKWFQTLRNNKKGRRGSNIPKG
jgi:hypothetical protein